jgi:DNA-binding HxlR family transcriptional regulator
MPTEDAGFIREVLGRVAGKWTLLVIAALLTWATAHHREILEHRACPGLTAPVER